MAGHCDFGKVVCSECDALTQLIALRASHAPHFDCDFTLLTTRIDDLAGAKLNLFACLLVEYVEPRKAERECCAALVEVLCTNNPTTVLQAIACLLHHGCSALS